MTTRNTVEALDISRWQGPSVDFQAVYDSGQMAVIMRSSYGRTKVDPMFEDNWARAREVDGLLLGAYHYGTADAGADAELEARNMVKRLRVVGYAPGDLPPALDWEWKSTDETWTPERHERWVAEFVEVIEHILGLSPMIYTGRNTWNNRMDMSSRFVHLPLWQADYDGEIGEMPWPEVTIHQYGVTDRGSVPGVETRIDRNRIHGGMATLEALAAGGLYTPANPWRLPDAPTPEPVHRGPVMAYLDLALDQGWSGDVALCQGLLYARGAALEADGLVGPKTREAYAAFSGGHLVVDWLELHGRGW